MYHEIMLDQMEKYKYSRKIHEKATSYKKTVNKANFTSFTA
ncbi:TPR repeat-containing protein [Listeria ivanovii FSL F6-596]|nr:TPR repeat-containing protein [Listeria ivanovii FSL F6-596]